LSDYAALSASTGIIVQISEDFRENDSIREIISRFEKFPRIKWKNKDMPTIKKDVTKRGGTCYDTWKLKGGYETKIKDSTVST